MLFADDPSPERLLLILGGVGSAVAALFAWLTARDKLRYDANMTKLTATVEANGKDIARLTAESKECHEAKDKLEAKFDSLQARYDARHGAADRTPEGAPC
jgi:hypothetical protein